MISECISDDDICPQMKMFNMAIPILMHFCSLISMMSNYFRQYIAGYIVTNFLHYSIKCHVSKASALEFIIISFSLSIVEICSVVAEKVMKNFTGV